MGDNTINLVTDSSSSDLSDSSDSDLSDDPQYEDDSDDGLTDIERIRKASHETYLDKKNEERRAAQRQKNKRKREEEAIHMDEFDILQTHWNRHYGTTYVSFRQAAAMFEMESRAFEEEERQEAHSSNYDPDKIRDRLVTMKTRLDFMRGLLTDRRNHEKRQMTATVEQERERLRQAVIDKHLRAIESLRRDERDLRHIRRAQHSHKMLQDQALSPEQKARLQRAEEHAARTARVNLKRRYM